MISLGPPPFRKHRGKPKPARVAPPTPPAGPLAVVGVIDVSYGGDVLSFTVVFNTTPAFPLNDVETADVGKWAARYAGGSFVGATLILVAYDQINVGLLLDEAQTGANEMFYSNAPSDISDALGRQLAAVAGYPLP